MEKSYKNLVTCLIQSSENTVDLSNVYSTTAVQPLFKVTARSSSLLWEFFLCSVRSPY